MAGMVAAYLILNALCVFAPQRPDPRVLFFWGAIFPVLAIVQTWLWYFRKGRRIESGIPAAMLLTLIFIFAGLVSFTICIQVAQI